MKTIVPGFKAGSMLLLLGAFMAGCGMEGTTADQTPGKPPMAQVVNNSGGRIDHVTVGDVTFAQNLSYNTTLYSADNGSYCGDGCATGFVSVAEGTGAMAVGQTAASGAVQVGSLGSFQKDKSYAINVRKVGASYCAELWQRMDTAPKFNEDMTRVLAATSC